MGAQISEERDTTANERDSWFAQLLLQEENEKLRRKWTTVFPKIHGLTIEEAAAMNLEL